MGLMPTNVPSNLTLDNILPLVMGGVVELRDKDNNIQSLRGIDFLVTRVVKCLSVSCKSATA